jgi:hypothetical protein
MSFIFISAIEDYIHMPYPRAIIIVASIPVFYAINKAREKKGRIIRINAIYGNTEIAERIIKKTLWVGETAKQVIDSFGRPIAVDDHVLIDWLGRTIPAVAHVLEIKRKQTWKYYQQGKNRFRLRIVIEDGVVVGWDKE